jgi:hypothetical protein
MFAWISNNIGGPAIVIFIGVLISAAGALWASMQQTASEQTLRLKNKEIAELNRSIAHSITGGDSFCYLAFSLPDNEQSQSLITAVHKGEYPLYDVNIRIVDLDKFDAHVKGRENPTLEDFRKADTNLSVGNLAPNQAAMIGRWPLPQSEEIRYNIFITARNGFVTELVRIKRIDDKWVSAYKVTSDSNRKDTLLYEKIDPDFPRDEAGEINWD